MHVAVDCKMAACAKPDKAHAIEPTGRNLGVRCIEGTNGSSRCSGSFALHETLHQPVLKSRLNVAQFMACHLLICHDVNPMQ